MIVWAMDGGAAVPRPRLGAVVIGPPGSGKTTFCDGMAQLHDGLKRPCTVVNLDPSADRVPYDHCSLDIRDLVTAADVMTEFELGPNGALLYCMQFLLENFDFLQPLRRLADDGGLVLLDCPGQVELYTHDDTFSRILARIAKEFEMELVVLNLVDSLYATVDFGLFLSVALMSLASMMRLELPHLNVLTKIDLVPKHASRVDIRTILDCDNLESLIDDDDDADGSKRLTEQERKQRQLMHVMAETIDDFHLVAFIPCSVQDKEAMVFVLATLFGKVGYDEGGLQHAGLDWLDRYNVDG